LSPFLIRTNRPFSGGQAGQINQAGDKSELQLPDGFSQSGQEDALVFLSLVPAPSFEGY
jgi:hypothetical protein